MFNWLKKEANELNHSRGGQSGIATIIVALGVIGIVGIIVATIFSGVLSNSIYNADPLWLTYPTILVGAVLIAAVVSILLIVAFTRRVAG